MYDWEPNDYDYWKDSINWDDYLDYAEENELHYKQISILRSMRKRSPSWKQIKAAKAVVEKIDEMREASS